MSSLSAARHAVADRVRAAGIDSSVNVFAYAPSDFSLPAGLVQPAGDTYAD